MLIVRQAWELGPFEAVLQNLHPGTPLPEQQNTKKLHGAKNNCAHVQLGQILNQKMRRQQQQKAQLPFLKSQ